MEVTHKHLDVFISYSPADKVHLRALEDHLTTLKRQGIIRAWHPGLIGAGHDEGAETASGLEAAKVILLLISASYLATKWQEMAQALERHHAHRARVISVIVDDCDWEEAPFATLKILPSDRRAVTSWQNGSEAWADVARGIRAEIKKLRRPSADVVHPSSASLDPIAAFGLSPVDPSVHSLPGRLLPELPPNNLPPRRDCFVGREAEFGALERLMTHEHQASVVQNRRSSIYGLGGIGKTSLALEYAYRNLERYPGGIWWVDAEGNPFTRMIELAEALRVAGPPSIRSILSDLREDRDRLALRVRLALQNQSEASLLVLDNVTDSGWRDLIPAGRVHVLVTTRDERLVVGRSTAIDVLTCADARELSIALAGSPSSGNESDALDRVVGELGGLAVAVETAARGVSRWARSWVAYEKHLRDRVQVMLEMYEHGSEYPRSTLAALALSIEQCRAESLERRILNLVAFLSAERIALSPILEELEVTPDCLDASLAFGTMKGLGLISLDDGSKVGSVHRLIQAAVRAAMTTSELAIHAERALRLIDCVFPETSDDVETWPTCARWLPHALAAARHAETLDVARAVRAHLIPRFAVYLQGRAAFAEAKGYLEQALALHEAEVGNDDPGVAAVLRSLGSVLHDLGDLGSARSCFERALTIDVAMYGHDHPDVARDVNDLGSLLMDLGDLTAARKHLERALSIDEANYGPDDPSVAIRLNNLGALLRDLGDFASARAYLERALHIDIRAYGPDHPTVAIGRTNLGRLLHDLGDLAGAREQFEEALTIDEHTYGCYHPRFALALNNRGRLLRDFGDLAGARADFERALAIVKAVHGPDHPDIARDMNNLGSVLRDLGELEGARGCFERVIKMAEATYGPEHPAVAIGCNNLGSVLQSLSDFERARVELERALSIAQASYGPDHPVVASIVNNLGRVLQALGDLPGAWQQIERAVAIATKALGSTHPSVQIFSRNLSRVGDALGCSGPVIGPPSTSDSLTETLPELPEDRLQRR
ncbi:MAG TPA: FxSxx-COOH system tetratricopeptide repeat protein [Candidatus Nanopelagicales bacterium]|nr:FxSxx-COOH system tetratricopeptide repeat protein [Candidatus Nanopelagicales bacterium]